MTTYFVKSNGNDQMDGRSKETTWKTIERFNAMILEETDQVKLIKR